jgi:FkbM family methyltransferase
MNPKTKVLFGTGTFFIDVSKIAIFDEVLFVPADEAERIKLFGDRPPAGMRKTIKVVSTKNNQTVEEVFEPGQEVFRVLNHETQEYEAVPKPSWTEVQRTPHSVMSPEKKLRILHSISRLAHCSSFEEYPEQILAMKYIPHDAVILELGGNGGRNSVTLGYIISPNSHNMVVFESAQLPCEVLRENRDLNNLKFYVENAALSKVRLQQNYWTTKPIGPSGRPDPSWIEIKTMTWSALQSKYRLPFDTLVADCEGALYQILHDEPDMLRNFRLIILENDFSTVEEASFVHNHFMQHGFRVICECDGPQNPPKINFYQVWRRDF